MNIDQPYFRFNPGAYQDGRSFEQSSDTCDVCQQLCGWKYVGGIYAIESPTVCARCIKGGKLAKFLAEGHFSLHDVEINDADASVETELLQQTPGVSCFNPFEWPVLDAMPLAFLGYGEDEAILKNAGAQDAIEAAFKAADWEFKRGTPTPYALVFKEVDGDRYRAVIDLD